MILKSKLIKFNNKITKLNLKQRKNNKNYIIDK